jgi:CDP-diacylglycerol---serine O-phosphatidyltransferase
VQVEMLTFTNVLFLITPLLIPVFSALRLAKFNIDERQTSEFIGLPTPASALLMVSLALIVFSGNNQAIKNFILSPWLLSIVFIADSLIMVSEIKLFSFKFKTASFSDNAVKYIFLAISVLLIGFLQYYAIPAVIILYILISIGINLLEKQPKI